jgi:hypothetical protein
VAVPGSSKIWSEISGDVSVMRRRRTQVSGDSGLGRDPGVTKRRSSAVFIAFGVWM